MAAIRQRALRIPDQQRLGKRVAVGGREIRSVVTGDYELQYEISGDTIIVLRIWHTRENR